MFVNLRTVALTLVVAAAAVRAVDSPAEPATNGTSVDTPSMAGNGTSPDTPSMAGNGTSPDSSSTAANGTSPDSSPSTPSNGTSTNADAPQPSNGPTGSNSRRALQACEWSCPPRGTVEFDRDMEGAFTCTYADGVTCTYQKTTGVLTLTGSAAAGGESESACPNAATALTAGCVPGQATNGGLLRQVRRARKSRRTSRDIQREALARRNML